MGLFGDLSDAVKKRMKDPPKYRDKREDCKICRTTGICQSCGGKPSYVGKYVAVSAGIIGLLLSLSSCNSGELGAGIGWFFGTVLLVGLVNMMWRCQCETSVLKSESDGKCTVCQGRGYNTVSERIGGTDIFQAVGQANEASKLTNEFGSVKGTSLADMESKIDRALQLNPNHFGANAIKGILHFDRGNHHLALRNLEQAELRKPRNIEIKEVLFVVHDQMGHQELAEQKYMEMIALGVKAQNRKQIIRSVTAGAVGGVVGGLVGSFIPFMDE